MVGLGRCYITPCDWFLDAIASLIGYDYKVAREIGSKFAPPPHPLPSIEKKSFDSRTRTRF